MSIEYKPLEKNLESGLSQLGSQIKGMPHIIIGNKSPSEAQNRVSNPIFNPKEQKLINQLKKWGLVFIVLFIVLYALYSIFF